MRYTEEPESLTESEFYRMIVRAIRAGVSASSSIFVYMSYEALQELESNTLRIINKSKFGERTVSTAGGNVNIVAIKEETDTITVSN